MAQIESAISDSLPAVSLAAMTEHDLLEIVEIEQCCGLSPWGWDSYHLELSSAPGAIMLVARINFIHTKITEGKGVAGFIVSRVVADELHINNVAVRPEWQRTGIGGQLLSAAVEHAANAGAHTAFLEVRASNRAAQKLYQHCGFHVVGQRKNYYRDPPEDALVMSVSLKSDP